MKKIRYGIIGAGYFGAELGRIIKKLDDAEVISIYDPENGRSVSDELNCDEDKNLDAILIRDDIDAVIVATPNYLHKEPVLKAAKYNKHIFCEKPIALNYTDCDEMVTAAKNSNVIFMAGHVMHFFRGIQSAKKIINEGSIGEVIFCHTARNGWEERQNGISWKKCKAKSGGHLYHHIHELDCIQSIMGRAKQVTMVGDNVAHRSDEFGDEDDMLFLTLEFDDNRYAICEYGSAFKWGEHYLLIQGTKGSIKIDMQDVCMTVKTKDGIQKQCVHSSVEVDEDRSRIYRSSEMDGAIMYGKPGKKTPLWLKEIMVSEIKFFNDILQGKRPLEEFSSLLDGSAARDAIATADAATLSLNENRKVLVKEVIEGAGNNV